jgi:hypothetical protein
MFLAERHGSGRAHDCLAQSLNWSFLLGKARFEFIDKFKSTMALGFQTENLLTGVVTEGVLMAGAGVLAGAAFGLVVASVAGSYFGDLKCRAYCR